MAEKEKDQKEPDSMKDSERTGEAERKRQDEEKAAAIRERQYRQGHVERPQEESTEKERKKKSE